MKNKSIIIMISVILVLVIAGGGFWVVKNQKESGDDKVLQNEIITQENNQNQKEVNTEEIDTSNWKTYRDEKYKFEIKYPEGWYVFDEGSNAFGGEWISILPEEGNDPNLIFNINRRILEDSNPLQWIKTNLIDDSIGGGQKIEVEEIFENNPYLYAFYVKLNNKDMYVRHKYAISNKKSMIYFNFDEVVIKKESSSNGKKEISFSQYLPSFKAMVNSIKFFD